MEPYICTTHLLLLVVLTVLPLATVVHSQVTTNTIYRKWSPQTVPNPQVNPAGCGRTTAGWVCDPDGIIDALKVQTYSTFNGVATAQGIIDHTEGAQKVCPSGTKQGFQMAAAVIGGIQFANTQNAVAEANSFANYLRVNTWKPGLCQNDIVIVFSLDTRTIGLSMGSRAQKDMSERFAMTLAAKASARLRPDTVGQELTWLLSKYENQLLKLDAEFAPFRIAMIVIASCAGVLMVIAVILALIHSQRAHTLKVKRRLVYEASVVKAPHV